VLFQFGDEISRASLYTSRASSLAGVVADADVQGCSGRGGVALQKAQNENIGIVFCINN